MNAEKRKALRLRVQSAPGIGNLRRAFFNTTNKLPAMLPVDEATQAKHDTLTRRFLGGKMPTRLVMMHRGHYAVRPCVCGIVFTAAVFPSLGGRENHKLCVMMSRLADAISYHFRASRMRGSTKYNYSIEQAAVDSEFLAVELDELSKLFVACGVPVMGNPVSEIKFAERSCCETLGDDAMSRIVVLEARMNSTVADAGGLRELAKVQDGRIDSCVKHGFDIEARCKEEVEHLRQYVNTIEERVTRLEKIANSFQKRFDSEQNCKVPAIGEGNGIPSAF